MELIIENLKDNIYQVVEYVDKRKTVLMHGDMLVCQTYLDMILDMRWKQKQRNKL